MTDVLQLVSILATVMSAYVTCIVLGYTIGKDR